ncbi:hypothetical protein CFP56_027609 [Quercus suber]|uniref:Uncharacterized protein n=1 Tax=Quercus suber TaxID=58331 RepID=A0AAW0JY54_QUESU
MSMNCLGEETPNQSDKPTRNEDNEEDEDEFNKWFHIGARVGFVVCFCKICGPLQLKSSCRDRCLFFVIE